ncbi:MAG: hypothetical protein EBV45_11410, partial [Chloroflexi bacterium]|nr:hypothetical protein [Chloroflexota bacterium]
MSTPSTPLRVGFVSADHLHFSGLLHQALACDEIVVVGMVIDDDEHRTFLAERFPSVPIFHTPEAMLADGRPEALITNRN